MDDRTLCRFVEALVSMMYSKGINKKTHTEMCALYSTVRAQRMFASTALLMAVEIVRQTEKCAAMLKLCAFVHTHMRYMQHTAKHMRKPLQQVFARRVKEMCNSTDTSTYEHELLACVEKYAGNEQMLSAVAMFVACIPEYKQAFWHAFAQNTKNRLVVQDNAKYEHKLVKHIARRMHRAQNIGMQGSEQRDKHMHMQQIHKKVVEYIDAETLYTDNSRCDIGMFDELMLCIRDVQTSNACFATQTAESAASCKLLAQTRWSYAKLDMKMPCEAQETWARVQAYCRDKGRKYELALCAEMSCMELEVNGTSVTCDFVQGAILMLLCKTEENTQESIAASLFADVTERHTKLVADKLASLVQHALVIECDKQYSVTTVQLTSTVDIYTAGRKYTEHKRRYASARCNAQSIVEAAIVRIAKTEKRIEMTEIYMRVQADYAVHRHECKKTC